MSGHPRAIVTLVPLLGPLHLRMPQYNVESVALSIRSFEPDTIALTPLTQGSLNDPAWQGCEDVALPHTVVPWARRAGVRLVEVGVASTDPAAESDFQRYLEGQDQGRALLGTVRAALAPVHALLARPLTLSDVRDELIAAVSTYQRVRETTFGEGPGTGWQRRRAQRLAENLRARIDELGAARVAVVAGLDDVPMLAEALAAWAELEPFAAPPTDAAIEQRALLDFAMIGETQDPASLLARLRQVESPEARYHEANLLLRHAHVAEALEVLEAASHTEFHEPYYLPGFLLARLGQLYDVVGNREAALRCYRGARALDFAPAEALAAAEAGLDAPFELPVG